MTLELSDLSETERLEEAIRARFEEAAQKVGCPSLQVELYFEMALDSCKPIEMREDPQGWGNQPLPKVVGSKKADREVLRSEYRVALEELLGSLDSKKLE